MYAIRNAVSRRQSCTALVTHACNRPRRNVETTYHIPGDGGQRQPRVGGGLMGSMGAFSISDYESFAVPVIRRQTAKLVDMESASLQVPLPKGDIRVFDLPRSRRVQIRWTKTHQPT